MSVFIEEPLNSLIHLDRMTDSTGLIQHGIYNVPRRESGYTTDDNARALRYCVRHWQLEPSPANLNRVLLYLSFMEHARNAVRGFHNFMGYQRDWLDLAGTGDCQGQAVLALAEVLGSDLPEGCRGLARELLKDSLHAMSELRSLRAQAYLIQAASLLFRKGVQRVETLDALARLAADRLVECYHRSSRQEWMWFESRLTYANAVLPHAMFDAAARWPGEGFLEVAESSFRYLICVTTSTGLFWPIGNQEWYSYGEEKSLYDQQPVEASTMASAAVAAFEGTGHQEYLKVFAMSYDWFFGKNSDQKVLGCREDGSCFDGLLPGGVNKNQGAESMLAFLWVLLLQAERDRSARWQEIATLVEQS